MKELNDINIEESLKVAASELEIMTLFIVAFLSLSVSLAYLFHFASSNALIESTLAAMGAWISYIIVHLLETGRFVDTAKDEKQLPTSDQNWIVFGISAFLFVAGMSLGSTGITEDNLVRASIGSGVLLAGYFFAHYEFSDSIV